MCASRTSSSQRCASLLCFNLLPCTQGKHPTMGTPHAKFTNYTFDVTEFMTLLVDLADSVLERKTAVFSQRILKES